MRTDLSREWLHAPAAVSLLVMLAACAPRVATRGSHLEAPAAFPVNANVDSIEPQQIAWSPNGRVILFSGGDKGKIELYRADADGQHLRRITGAPGNSIGVAWAPDGKSIVFDSKHTGAVQIYRAAPDGTGATQLTPGAFAAAEPTVSPDGKRIAFMGKPSDVWQLFLMDADGRNVTRLTHTTSNEYNPQWSPNGDLIAFESDRDVRGIDEIYVIRPDGSGQRRLTNNTVNDVFPTWSLDGGRIQWVQVANRRGTLYEMASDGMATRRIAENVTYAAARPGSGLLAVKVKDTVTSLWHLGTMRRDGSGLRRLILRH